MTAETLTTEVSPGIPLPNWLKERSAGLLLHLSSLPGEFGIGNMGKPSRELIDFLSKAGFRHWQICPVGPTSFGDSPYQSFSSFAGNPYFLDWNPLLDIGLVDENDLTPLYSLPSDAVAYGDLYERFWIVARKAALRFESRRQELESIYGSYEEFIAEKSSWIESYALFCALKAENEKKPWWLWPEELRTFEKAHHRLTDPELAEELNLHYFLQYLFFSQWKALRSYASSRKISILGDLPIYVAPDCADVWQRADLFQLDITTGLPTAVAGVPPDYFNPAGQLWGNPLYDWAAHKAEDYTWWMERLAAQNDLFDVTRIDHFRGFHDYWSIPADHEDACNGVWESGPGVHFFNAVREHFPTLPFLAEDLGLLNEGVHALRKATNLPGMAVLQFAFDGDPDNLYLPHNLSKDLVLYTGTHDNDTSRGWYESSDEEVRGNFRSYFSVSGEDAPWDLLRAAYRTVSNLVVIPVQDTLSLGSEARLNRPGHAFGNWSWRMTGEQLTALSGETATYLREQAKASGRLPLAEKA
ncbi:MAG: 4-alpha-glucanotransferase [Opitutae bacterium]|jgi:4-alpha-glucanotransferase|nr:4-alpha-glucanotransferase [Opitutae bacterium]MBT6852162.1 4-alpha-glucanotransferase [Opitutae bacterium]MBT7924230.1 4-alpha-glucanotransferase [Opitutae bacterium]